MRGHGRGTATEKINTKINLNKSAGERGEKGRGA